MHTTNVIPSSTFSHLYLSLLCFPHPECGPLLPARYMFTGCTIMSSSTSNIAFPFVPGHFSFYTPCYLVIHWALRYPGLISSSCDRACVPRLLLGVACDISSHAGDDDDLKPQAYNISLQVTHIHFPAPYEWSQHGRSLLCALPRSTPSYQIRHLVIRSKSYEHRQHLYSRFTTSFRTLSKAL